MDRINTLNCLTIVFTIIFINFSIVGSDIVEQKKIIDVVNYCDTMNILHDSSYLAKCKQISLPTTFKEDDIDLTLCIMVYDTINKICHNIVSKDYKIQIPESPKQLDDSIRKFEPKSSDYDVFIDNLCKTMISVFRSLNDSNIQSNSSVDPYIKYGSETLFPQPECNHTCHKPKFTVHPLCMIFLWFHELLINVKRPKFVSEVNKNILTNTANTYTVQNELSTVENIKISHINNNVENKITNFEDHTILINKSYIKQSENTLPTNGSKRQDIQNSSIIHNEYTLKKESDNHKKEDSEKDEAFYSIKDNIVTDKTLNIITDNPKNSLQQEEINSDKVLNEDQLSKKINDDKDDEGDDQDNTNDLKEQINSINDEIFSSRDSGDAQGVHKNIKSYPALSIVKDDDSHFFTYFSIIFLICIGLYIGYHNKQKILAIALEGRRSRRGRGSRRRPSTANYRKLDCNLEEAVTSQFNANVTHVIY